MTLLTALELAGNYPENILINSAKAQNGKFMSFCMTENGQIQKLMLSTHPVFETEEQANDEMHKFVKEAIESVLPKSSTNE